MNNNANKHRFSEGILILLVSSGAYLFSYYYELGYIGYFGIPSSFIKISLNSILRFGAVLFGIVFFLFPIVNLVPYLLRNKLHVEIRRFIAITILLLIVVIFQAYIFGLDNFEYWKYITSLLLGVFIVFTFLTFIFPLLTRRNVKGYMAKIEAQRQFDVEFNKEYGGGIYDAIEERFGLQAVMVIIFLGIGILVSQSVGLAEAVNKNKYLITNTKPELIVLRIYDDLAICSTLEKGTNTLENDIRVIKISEQPDLVFQVRDIGQVITAKTITNNKQTLSSTPINPTIAPILGTPTP